MNSWGDPFDTWHGLVDHTTHTLFHHFSLTPQYLQGLCSSWSSTQNGSTGIIRQKHVDNPRKVEGITYGLTPLFWKFPSGTSRSSIFFSCSTWLRRPQYYHMIVEERGGRINILTMPRARDCNTRSSTGQRMSLIITLYYIWCRNLSTSTTRIGSWTWILSSQNNPGCIL